MGITLLGSQAQQMTLSEVVSDMVSSNLAL